MSEHWNDASTKARLDAEICAVPSPREEASAAWRASWSMILTWWAICGLRYHFYSRYRVTTSDEASESMLVAIQALVPVLLTPALPMRRLARLLIALRRREPVTAALDGSGVTWTGRTGSRVPIDHINCCLTVRAGSGLFVVVTTDGDDAPLSLRVADDRAARRLVSRLGVGKSKMGIISFPLWAGEEVLSILTGKKVRRGPALKRVSLALLCGGCAGVLAIAQSLDPWWALGLIIFLGLPALALGSYLFLASWSSLLRERAPEQLTIDTAKICLDGKFLCYLTDRIALRIIEGPCLEISAACIPDGKRILKPWRSGDLHEIELMKATIEAYHNWASERVS